MSDKPLYFDKWNVMASLCRDSFYDFFLEFWECVSTEKFVSNWHVKELCDDIQEAAMRVIRGENKEYDILINISPGTSKSTLVSQMLPAWAWTIRPDIRSLCASHSIEVATKDSMKTRDIVKSEKYQRCFPNVQIRPDQDAKTFFQTSKGGWRMACSVGSKNVMGNHAHFLLADDTIDPETAKSDVERNTAREWIGGTFSNRAVNKQVSLIIQVQQRVHEDDTSNQMLEWDNVKHYCLPAEMSDTVKPEEWKQFYVDGLFDPVRLNRETLAKELKRLGPYAYAAQYDQRPAPAGGGMFEIDKIELKDSEPVKLVSVVRAWDKACLVAGTMIATNNGDKAIEALTTSDMVLTRQGYRRVLWAGETKKVNKIVSVGFPNGNKITGTPDHLIWTENRGWIRLDSLRGDDYVLNLCQKECQILKLSDSWEQTSVGDQEKGISNPGGISCTAPFGDTTTAPSRRNMKSIIKMETGIITQLKTLSVCLDGNISGDTLIGVMTPTKKRTLRKHGPPPRNGSRRILEPKSIRTNAKQEGWLHGKTQKSSVTCASYAGLNVRADALVTKSQNTAARNAKENHAISSMAFVRFAKNHFYHGVERDAAPLSADTNGGRRIPVFDIQVEDVHEFFANGILVHNSTAGGGDYSVGAKMGMDKDGYWWILDMVRGQWGATDRENIIRQSAIMDGVECPVIIEREPSAGGKESAERTIRLTLSGFIAREQIAQTKKEVRAHQFASQVGAGNVRCLNRHWTKELLHELSMFPNGKHDDQIDGLAMCFNNLTQPTYTVGCIDISKY